MMKPIESLNRIKNNSVLKHTKRDWAEWVTLLSKAGAQSWTHQEIAAFLKKKYKLTSWWQQWVTSGFETYVGRRKEGANAKGTYSVTATKTIHLEHKLVWTKFASPEGVQAWLKPLNPFPLVLKQTFELDGGVFGELRTMKAPERIRLTWQEEEWPKKSTVQVHIISRKNGSTIIAIMHEGIQTPRIREDLRAHWKKSLTEFCDILPESQISTRRKGSSESSRKTSAISKTKSAKRRGSTPRNS
ncbi:MAG: SRPBCC domain-containing protein [Bdellovibrio sp.]